MNGNIEVDDVDYEYILSKGGKVKQFSVEFKKNDSLDKVFKPIIEDLKYAKGLIIDLVTSNKKVELDYIASFIEKINNFIKKDTNYSIAVHYEDLKVGTFKFDILISGLPED